MKNSGKGDNIKIEDDTDEEDVIVDKPSKNEYYEEIPSATGKIIIEEKSTSKEQHPST